jgi:hypothetical protein
VKIVEPVNAKSIKNTGTVAALRGGGVETTGGGGIFSITIAILALVAHVVAAAVLQIVDVSMLKVQVAVAAVAVGIIKSRLSIAE